MTVRASVSPRRSTKNSLRGETSRRVIATLISTGMVFQPIAANATPTNGTVVGGNATIVNSGNTTTIEQIDARVVIDWESFDIDANETVRFNQPGSQSVALNRVLGELPTDIRGQLLANGHVWIVNRNGVTFHAGSVVNVGGLLATTADISNTDFLAGQNNFTIPGEDGATVTNHGSITFGNAGLAGLVAPGAANHGQIAGRVGSVIVAGERTFAIDFAGDGIFAFEPRGAADFRGHASNTGTISNSGGYILIAARTASGMVDEAISLDGIVEATTAEMRDGRIVLSGGDGLVNVAGTVDASGGIAETGGSVQVSGGRVNIAATAEIDVSGGTGGGTAEIGGGYQGASLGEGLRNSQDTIVQRGATISADAASTGDGGMVVVWAEGNTAYAGEISATGGMQSGDGGTVEVSGRQTLTFAGTVDTRALNGQTGTLLLDPDDITIDAAMDSVNVIDVATLETALNTNNVTISTSSGTDPINNSGGNGGGTDDGNIVIATPIIATIANPLGTTLTLEADNDVFVNGAITDTGPNGLSVVVDASNDINLNATLDVEGDLGLAAGGNVSINADVSAGGTGNIAGSLVTITGDTNFGALTVTATDVAVVGATTVFGAADFTATGTVGLSNAGNNFRGPVDASGSDITIADVDALTLGDVNASGDLDVSVGGLLTQTGPGAGVTVGDDTILTARRIKLGAGDNDFDGSVAATATGGVLEISDLNDLTLGSISGTDGAIEITAGGRLNLTDDVTLGGTEVRTTTLTADRDGTTDEDIVVSDGVAISSTGRLELFIGGTGSLTDGADAGQDGVALTSGTQGNDNALILPQTNFNALDLTISSDGAITQVESVTLTGQLTASTTGDPIRLDDAANNFRGPVDASGSDIAIVDVDALTLGDVNASGDLDVSVGGLLTQTGPGTGVTVGGDTTLTARRIKLGAGDNDFDGSVEATATGGVLEISDLNDLTLGSISGTDGAIEITAGGRLNITDDVTLGGTEVRTTALTADRDGATDEDIVVSDGVAISSTGRLELFIGGTGSLTDGADAGQGGVALTSGTQGNDNALILPQTNFNALDLTISSDGAITQTASATITGRFTATTTGDPVRLDYAGNNFRGPVDASGSDITIVDVDALTLGDVNASGDLDVSVGGLLTQTGPGTGVTVGGDTTLTARRIKVGAGDNDFDGSVEATATGGVLEIFDLNDLTLGSISGADGAIEITAGGRLSVTDNVTLGGAEVRTTTLTADRAGTTDEDIVVSGGVAISSTGRLELSLGGGGALIDEAGAIAGEITLRSGTVGNGNALVLPRVSLNALDLTISSDGAIRQIAPATLTGRLSAITTGDLIRLDNAGNEFSGIVDLEGSDVTLVDNGDLALGNVVASNLTVDTDDTIAQETGASLDVTGTTTVDASGAVTLEEENNDLTVFAGRAASLELVEEDGVDVSTFEATGGDASISSDGDIGVASTLTATGDITLSSDGAIAGNLGSEISGENVSVSADSVSTDTVTANAGDIDVTATTTAALNGPTTATGDVTVSGGGGVSLAGGGSAMNLTIGAPDVDLTGLTFDATAGTTLVNTGTGDTIVGADSADANDTTFEVTDADLASISGDLTIRSGGGRIEVQGASLKSGQSLNLDAGTSGAVSFTTARTRIRGGGNLSVTDAASITSSAQITVNGDSQFESATDVTLADTSNNFVGTVSASGTSVTLADVNALELDEVTADTLKLNTGGAVSQSMGGAVIASSTLNVTTDGRAIDLQNAGNSIAALNADTTDGGAAVADVAVATNGDIAIGDIEADTLTVASANGNITDGSASVAGEGIDAQEVILTADAGDITLNADANNVTGSIDASAENITLEQMAALVLGDIDASADLRVTTDGALTQAPAHTLTVASSTSLAAASIDLSNATNDFDGPVGAAAANGSVELVDRNDIVLGDVDADTLAVTALAGSISDDGVGNAAGADVDVAGETSLSASGSVILDDLGNNFDSDGNEDGSVAVVGTQVTLNDIDALILGTITADALTATAAGDIADATASTLMIAGVTTLTATGSDITLDEVHGFGGRVDAVGDTIALNDMIDLQLGSVEATVALNATAQSGDITDTDGLAIIAPSANFTAANGDVALDNLLHDFDTVGASARNVALSDRDGVNLGPIVQSDANGALEVIANGAVTNTAGAIVASGDTTVQTDGDDITLNNPANEFAGIVTLDADREGSGSAGNVTVVQGAGSLTLGDVDANNIDVSTSAAGASIDAGAGVQNSTGTARYTTNGGNIDLSNDGNDFIGAVSLNGDTVTVSDATGLVLDTATVNILNVEALNGSISDNAGEAITVSGATTLNAGGFDIELDNADIHDFSDSADFVATGGDIIIDDIDGIQLGALSLATNTDQTIAGSNAGNLTINAGGDITQTAGANVPGRVEINNAGFDVTLDQANTLDGRIDIAAVDITLKNNSGGARTNLGDIDASNDLEVIAGGDIVDGRAFGAGDDINVAGRATLSGQSVVLNDTTNDFGGTVDVAAFVDVILNDVNDITLGAVSTPASQSLRVTAGGSIDDTDGQSITTGAATLTAETGSIVLDSDHDFNTVVAEAATDLTLNDIDDLTLGRLLAGGAISVTAESLAVTSNIVSFGSTVALTTTAGDIAIDGGTDVRAEGQLTLTPVGGALIDGDDGEEIRLVSGDSFVLPVTDLAFLDLRIEANGDVTQVAPSRILETLDIRTSGGLIDLTEANTFGNVAAVTTLDGADAVNVEIADATGGVTLGRIVASDLTVTAAGDIVDVDDTAGTTIRTTGETSLDAGVGGIALDNPNHNFAGPVNTTADGDVELADQNNLTLGTSNSGGTFVARAGSDLLIDDDVTSAGDVTLEADRHVRVRADVNMAGNDLSLRGDADNDGEGEATVGTSGNIEADIVMASAGEVVRIRNTNATSINVTDAGSVEFSSGTTSISGDLVVASRGDVSDLSNSTLIVAGDTEIRAAGNAVQLNSATNDFVGTVSADPAVASLELRDANDLTLGRVQSVGDIDVRADGSLMVSDAIDVQSGAATLRANSGVSVDANIAAAAQALTIDSDLDNDGVGGLAMAANAELRAETVIARAGDDATLANVTGDSIDVDAGGSVSTTGSLEALNGDVDVRAGDDVSIGASITASEGVTLRADNDGSGDGGVTVASATLIEGADVDIRASEDIRLSETAAETLRLEGRDVTFGDGSVDVVSTLTIDATGDVSDIGDAVLSVGGDATIRALTGFVSLDNASNDFMRDVRAAANALTLQDRSDLSVTETTVAGNTDLSASDRLVLSRSELGDVQLAANDAVDVENIEGTRVAIDSGGTASISRFNVDTLNIEANTSVDVSAGAASASATIDGGGTATVSVATVRTPRLMVAGAGSARLDRVGDTNGTIEVTADEIALGVIRGNSANLQALDGDIRTVDSVAQNSASLTRVDGSTTTVDVNAVSGSERLIDIAGPLSVGATGDVMLAQAAIAGVPTRNSISDIVVDENVGGALIVETAESLSVTQGASGNTVSAIDIVAEGDVNIDAEILGNADVVAVSSVDGATSENDVLIAGTIMGDVDVAADGNATILGEVDGNASVTAGQNALIDGSVAGDATAIADEDATVSGAISGDVVVDSGDDALINGIVGGNASATGGESATIQNDVAGNAVATATNADATINGSVGGSATAESVLANAVIDGTVGGNASATGGLAATIQNAVTGSAVATATDGDATISGDVGNDATAQSVSADALINGTVGNNATATGGESATIQNTVAGNAVATATNADATINGNVGGNATTESTNANAVIDGTVGGDASATGGLAATVQNAVTGSAVATATDGDATINGDVGVDAIAQSANADALINGTVGGNASATGGESATIQNDVAGNAAATATNADATIGGSVGGDATVESVAANAVIDGAVGGNASATGGLTAAIQNAVTGSAVATAADGDATINGDVGVDATAQSVNADALINGTVGNNAAAESIAANAVIDGTVGGNASATGGLAATIQNAVTGSAVAMATDGGATITGDVGVDATAQSANADALINGTVGGNASATGGLAATIQNAVTGSAVAMASEGDATINGDVGVDATVQSVSADALINGTVGNNATVTGGENATIQNDVAGTAVATATNADATIIGIVGGAATADAGNNALIEGTVASDATAIAGNIAEINASVMGDALANASGGTDAVVRGTVSGDARVLADRDATLSADVGQSAQLQAGRNASAGGEVTEDATITANQGIVLGSESRFAVGGALIASADANGTGGGAAGITQTNEVEVAGPTTVSANQQSDIVLSNAANDFSTVTVADAADVTIVDADTLSIASVEQATGDVTVEVQSGRLTLQDTDYRIAANKRWTLRALDGDVALDGRIDSEAGQEGTGSLTVSAGPSSTIWVKNLVGSQERLDDVTFENAANVIMGLRSEGDFEDPDANADDDFLLPQGTRDDIFFSRTLNFENIIERALIVLPTDTEFVFDFEDQYFGVNITEQISFDTNAQIELFGQIGSVTGRAAGLTSISGPLNGNQRFNNCLVGDPNSCSALNQANVLRLVDFTPDNVFVLDTDRVEQLFLSFGNEELWGLPSVFAIDIEDDEEEGDAQ